MEDYTNCAGGGHLADSRDLEVLRLLLAALDNPCRAGFAIEVDLAAASAATVLDGAPFVGELRLGRQPRTLSRREQLTNLYWSRIQGQTQARTRPGGCPAPVHGCQIVCGVRVEWRLRRDACGIEEAD